MKAQEPGLFILGAESVAHHPRPHPARGAKLCHLFEKIVVHVEEEREPWPEVIDFETGIERRLNVSGRVSQRESDLLDRVSAGFANMIAADRDGVPLRHLLLTKREDVSDDAHRLARRINVGPPCDVLLQD